MRSDDHLVQRYVRRCRGDHTRNRKTPGQQRVRGRVRGAAQALHRLGVNRAALEAFVFGDRHRRAMEAVDQLTHGTAFATIDSEVPFDRIGWDDVKELLAPVS